jgi:ADP-heptose:LPS heptosyltransferase
MRRVIVLLPCCIGDVVNATAALAALRQGRPHDHLTLGVGSWSRAVVEDHPALNALITIPDQLKRPLAWLTLVRLLRAERYDLAIALDRSPLMSAAVAAAGIPERIGLTSVRDRWQRWLDRVLPFWLGAALDVTTNDWRGWGYSRYVPLNAKAATHEAEIYLDAVHGLGIPTDGFYANVPVKPELRAQIQQQLLAANILAPYIVVHPGGGSNPGMQMASKRYPPAQLAQLVELLAQDWQARVLLIGAASDADLVNDVQQRLTVPSVSYVGKFSLAEIGALAHDALLYLGNDTGLTHLAAASGARTVMLMGPSDPLRYAPYAPHAIAVWQPTVLPKGGVASRRPTTWDWQRDGISVAAAYQRIRAFVQL